MRANFKIFSAVLAATASVVGALLPALAFAQSHASITIGTNLPGVYNVSTVGPCGWVVDFYNFALIIGGILAFGAVVFGGILYATSAGNASRQSEGRSWIWSALIGLLLLAGAYLILQTINPNLTKCTLPTLSPLSATGGNASSTPNNPSNSSSSIPAKIAAAANAYKGTSTANGPGSGTVACAWAVNNVLTKAGVANLDSTSVQSMENAITAGRGTLVDSSQAVAGDIVIEAGDGHVGICLNTGCTQVLSNSSSNASFTWVSNTSFTPSYSNGPGRIYQINS